MNRDELLDQLYAVRRRLTVLIAQTAQEKVDPDELAALMTQRDRVVWLCNRFVVADLVASLAETDAALQNIAAATTRLEELKSTADDIAEAIKLATAVVTAASPLLGALET